MAIFEGTREEFTRFLGSYFRIKVLFITRKYKQQIGKCEECHSTTKLMEAAHVHGKGRPLLIKRILSKYEVGSTVKVDLREFEELFVQAHEPLESTIRILCSECHRKYDSLPPASEYIPETQETEVENLEAKVSKVAVHSTNRTLMDKSLALQLINRQSKVKLNDENAVFSNVNAAINAWWLEPKTSKFDSELNLVLNYPSQRKLYYFRIPAGTIKYPGVTFELRNDKPYSKVYIPVSTIKFVDKKGFDFTPFLVGEVPY